MAAGAGEILQLIRSGRATTRTAVLDATGLSRVTVAQRIDALLAAGIIRAAGDAGATGGRRAERLVFDPEDSLVLVAALEPAEPSTRSPDGGAPPAGPDAAALAVVDPHGTLLARAALPVDLSAGPAVVVPQVLDGFDALLADAGIEQSAVGGVALSVPGPVDPHDHRLSDPPVLPGWGGWPVVEAVRTRFDVPVHLENDADATAYGEYTELAGRHQERPQPFVLVKASNFLGAGLVLDGRIYRGTDGGAGDIGHVDVGGDAVCRCGRRGCLAAEAGGAALLRRLGKAGVDVGSLAELCALAERGDPRVTAELDRAAALTGRVLAVLVGVLNPADLVVTGELAVPTVMAGVRAGVYAGAQPRATARLRIRPAVLGPDAVLVGLARVAVDDRFSAPAVDARLG
ncbi:ROK family protein [Promicromonospora thailandica]|uniref:Sugar kinase of the NBD/HSP70 family, may containing an N-terminal HTH domain n=1 Tax=Promicromonospora thailandica TaxID=765201 RepID=A0A9X2G5A8_9MICO|nr:ROK family protein [Promicromonospora thailandica]MCP2267415.1 Sugar kinase of the NBD/HSP70 family, may containing an N-terminal HTH domain [Promicromonospora thailandica]BFF19561.1 ROK family protein [Promicromonospora thailandica]